MPRLPTSDAMTRVISQGATSVITDKGAGTGNAGIKMIGQSLTTLGDSIADSQNRYDSIKAEASLKTLIAESDQEANHDNDHTTLADRYEENFTKGVGEIAAGIRSPRARSEFEAHHQGTIAQKRAGVEKLAHAKYKDSERADITDTVKVLRDQAVATGDDENIELIEGLGWTAQGEEILNAQERQAMIADAKLSITRGRLETLEPTERLAAIKAGKAKGLAPETVVKLERAARAEIVAQGAQNTVDGLMDQGLSSTEAQVQIDKISDVKKRDEVNRRYQYDNSKRERAKVERQSDLFEANYYDVRSGKLSVNDIDDATVDEMGVNAYKQLIAAEAQFSVPRQYSDPDVQDMLFQLAGRGDRVKLRKAFMANAGSLNASDLKRWSEETAKAEGTINPLFTTQQSMSAKIGKLDLGKADTVKAKQVLTDKMSNWYEREQAVNGREPTEAETQKFMDSALMEYSVPDAGWFGFDADKRAIEMTDDDWINLKRDRAANNPEEFEAVVNMFKSKGIDPSNEQFAEVLQEVINRAAK